MRVFTHKSILHTAFLIAGIAVLNLFAASLAQVSQGMSQVNLGNPPQMKSQEFDAINQIMDVIDHTNVRHVDKASYKSFQDFMDMKNDIYMQPVTPKMSAQKPQALRSFHGIQAPRSFDQKAY